MKRHSAIPAVAALLCASVCVAAVNDRILKKITVPGTGGWDYLTVDDALPDGNPSQLGNRVTPGAAGFRMNKRQ